MKSDSTYFVSDDPIDQFLLKEFIKLKMQNQRYEKQIRDSSNLLKVKVIEEWQAKDFFNYFCEKYTTKYGSEYKMVGSMGTAITKLEKFIHSNRLSGEDYKRFIDIAFGRYFNDRTVPVLGNICSLGLYEKLMGKIQKFKTASDLYNLDARIARESEKFEKDLEETKVCYAKRV